MSDFSMAEILAATGPLPDWPQDQAKQITLAVFVLHKLQARYEKQRVDMCFHMGGFGDFEFDSKMAEALRRLARNNSKQKSEGKQTGLMPILRHGLQP